MLGRDSSHCGALMGSSTNQDLGNEFGMWNKYGDQGTLAHNTYKLLLNIYMIDKNPSWFSTVSS